MKISKVVVSAIDIGDSCDGKPRVLFITDKMEEAQAYVRNDMEDYIDEATDDNGSCAYDQIDFNKMFVKNGDYQGCEWNIETITHEIPDEFKKYLEDYLRLLQCDYDGILELLDSDPKRTERVKLINRIESLVK